MLSKEQLENYFGDDDYQQLIEYILNILNKKIDIETCIEEVKDYE